MPAYIIGRYSIEKLLLGETITSDHVSLIPASDILGKGLTLSASPEAADRSAEDVRKSIEWTLKKWMRVMSPEDLMQAILTNPIVADALVAPSSNHPVVVDAKAVAASLSEMIIDWVTEGNRMGIDWRPGLSNVIERRLKRLLPALATRPVPSVAGEHPLVEAIPLEDAYDLHGLVVAAPAPSVATVTDEMVEIAARAIDSNAFEVRDGKSKYFKQGTSEPACKKALWLARKALEAALSPTAPEPKR